ncbi:DNA polymerase III subunit gamma/tau [Desulfofustis limnaeus]|jgi:DNA polymerase-3 subunit gamma/tau|uniref:DNA polymerase III subunit gamma/tau n=1 Tax=Desulfofustis limnaeus TaxID=2740163 RepID=A0ABM7W9Q5_9BACT|nr:DNA polymerase III subunit gamma/tau [Desulfofustis limnaeus]MDX9896466.1 DNA polymerase III subunit gamma/tau [Desulfofustis sp.]BDD87724.1 DNA polymerase III subunit gamma/tau [Desulfofustis limnaeus]
MSYLVLARKFRPQSFADVVGQKPVVKTLQNSLKRGRVAHAILFSGVRGVGKTTLARLMAKALNCASGPTPTPCNSCSSCRQIAAGTALDLHEIDGASNRGIQEVRDLKDKIKFMPAAARYKVIIIDEVHMLTTEAFNALLKTLEEPPEHVYFMFATTELHKIPITILSRCQRYELQRVTGAELGEHFSRLAAAEGVSLEAAALALIVREAEGSVRDGLSLLDQVFSYGDEHITARDVADVLGLVGRDVLHDIARALLGSDRQTALARLADAFEHGMDLKRFMNDLLDCFRSLMLIRISGCEHLIELPAEEIALLAETARQHSLETIHQQLNLLLQTAETIRHSSQPRLALEIAFLSIIESGNVIGVETLLSQLDEVLGKLPEPEPPATAPAESGSRSGPPPVDSPPVKAAAPPRPPSTNDLPAAPPPSAEPPPVAPPSPAAARDSSSGQPEKTTPPPPSPGGTKQIRKDWLDFIAYVRNRREWMAQNLQQATAVKEHGSELNLEFDTPAECALLRSKENRQALTEYVLDFFQKDFTIHIISPEDPDDPGVAVEDGPKKRRQQLAAHPLVRMTEEIFGGQAGDIRISQPNR